MKVTEALPERDGAGSVAVWSIETVADGMFTLFICRAMFVLSTEPAGTYIVYRAIYVPGVITVIIVSPKLKSSFV